ncbi:MAG: hypothetical protein RLZZ515_1429 [Cyanobacteriota bacterium]|jgi:hypothetical protein
MTAYRLVSDSVVLRISDNAFIPTHRENSDYLDYLDWLEAGNTPEPALSEEPQPGE